MFRAYRVKETGQWCGPLMENGFFSDDGLERADRVAATLGLLPGTLEVVDSPTDPRTGTLLEDPNVAPPPPPPRASNESIVVDLVEAIISEMVLTPAAQDAIEAKLVELRQRAGR